MNPLTRLLEATGLKKKPRKRYLPRLGRKR
jgi:hypothetical protein